MFFILINIEIFGISSCEFLSKFFVIARYKYMIFGLEMNLGDPILHVNRLIRQVLILVS